jgi:hypothetical protein
VLKGINGAKPFEYHKSKQAFEMGLAHDHGNEMAVSEYKSEEYELLRLVSGIIDILFWFALVSSSHPKQKSDSDYLIERVAVR